MPSLPFPWHFAQGATGNHTLSYTHQAPLSAPRSIPSTMLISTTSPTTTAATTSSPSLRPIWPLGGINALDVELLDQAVIFLSIMGILCLLYLYVAFIRPLAEVEGPQGYWEEGKGHAVGSEDVLEVLEDIEKKDRFGGYGWWTEKMTGGIVELV